MQMDTIVVSDMAGHDKILLGKFHEHPSVEVKKQHYLMVRSIFMLI